MSQLPQLQMIDKTRSIAQKDINVSAVLMYGSFTKDEGDQYSDIEFYIFLNAKEKFSGENWVSQIHPLAVYFKNEFGSEVAIFENMVRGEFHFLTTREMNVIKSWEGLVTFSDFEKMILVDKDGLLINTLNQLQTKEPVRTKHENVLWLSQSLLNLLVTTGNLIKRQEYAHAYQSLSNVQRYLLWLIRVATKQTNHWESPTKNLEKDIDPDWYHVFQQTTTDLDSEKIDTAFKNALIVSRKLFDQLNIEGKLKELLGRIE